MDDKTIVSLFLAREETAIAHTRTKYGNRLRAISRGIVNDLQTAEECESTTYFTAWRTIPPHEPHDYLYAFLARIIRHLSLNCCRTRNQLKRNTHLCTLSAELDECIAAPDDCACKLDELAFQQAINGFLATLPEEKRNLFLRRYWYLDSIEAIATHFGMTQSKVKTTLFRCRNALRDYLEQEGYVL